LSELSRATNFDSIYISLQIPNRPKLRRSASAFLTDLLRRYVPLDPLPHLFFVTDGDSSRTLARLLLSEATSPGNRSPEKSFIQLPSSSLLYRLRRLIAISGPRPKKAPSFWASRLAPL